MKNKTTNIDLSNFYNDIKGKKTSQLGKGISALLSGNNKEDKKVDNLENYIETVRLAFCVPSRFQARKNFDEFELEDLSASIKEHGIIQPVILRKLGEESYEIIAGERRCRAAKLAGLNEVPAIVSKMSDKQAMEIGLIENLQREDLNPLEEALAYKQLIDKYNYTHESIASSLGKSRSYITNNLRILNLSEKILSYLADGLISMGHAKVLVGTENAEEFAYQVVENNLSVRQLESLIKSSRKKLQHIENTDKIINTKSKHIDNDILDWCKNNNNDNPNIKIDSKMTKSNILELKIKFKDIEDVKALLKV